MSFFGSMLNGAFRSAGTAAGGAAAFAFLSPTKTTMETIFAEIKNIFEAFNPGIQITKAFRESEKLLEKFTAANLNYNKAQAESYKLFKDLNLRGSILETQKQFQLNLEGGIRANSKELLGMQERMRVTGQKTDGLTKAMANLGFETGDNADSMDSLITSIDATAKVFKVTPEKIVDSINSLNKETADLATIFGESKEIKQFTGMLAGLTRGGLLSKEDQNNLTKFLYSSDANNIQLRALLGVQEGYIKSIATMDPKKQAEAVIELAKMLDKRISETFREGNQNVYQEIQKSVQGLVGIEATLNKLSNLTMASLNSIDKLAEGAADPYSTLAAQIEEAANPYQTFVKNNLIEYRQRLVDISKSLNLVPAAMAHILFGGIGQDAATNAAFVAEATKGSEELRKGEILSDNQVADIAEKIKTIDASWWDSTQGQIEAFIKGVGKETSFLPENFNRFAISWGRETLKGNVNLADAIADNNVAADELYEAIYEFKDRFEEGGMEIPTQLKESLGEIFKQSVIQIRKDLSSMTDPAEKEAYKLKSFAALRSLDISDITKLIDKMDQLQMELPGFLKKEIDSLQERQLDIVKQQIQKKIELDTRNQKYAPTNERAGDISTNRQLVMKIDELIQALERDRARNSASPNQGRAAGVGSEGG